MDFEVEGETSKYQLIHNEACRMPGLFESAREHLVHSRYHQRNSGHP